MGSEATPLMLTILEGEKLLDDDDEQQQNAASSFEDDDASFTRVHRRWQQSTSSASERRGSSLLSFGSALLNFTNNNNNYNNNKQQQQGQHQHRRSPTSSIFDFGSTIIRELSHDFVDYEESESIALNALFSIAQPVATADDGEHIMMMRHPTHLIPMSLLPQLS